MSWSALVFSGALAILVPGGVCGVCVGCGVCEGEEASMESATTEATWVVMGVCVLGVGVSFVVCC